MDIRREDAHEDLKAFLDDELSPERAAEVRAVLDRDPALRQEAEIMKAISGEIKSAATEPQVKGLDAAIGRLSRPRGLAFPRWGIVAASVCGLFLVGMLGQRFDPLNVADGPTTQAAEISAAAPSAGLGMPAPIEIDAERPRSLDQQTSPSDLGAPTEEHKSKTKTEPYRSGDGGSNAYSTDLGHRTAPGTVSSTGRKVVRNADMAVKVKDVAKGAQDVERQVDAMGGFVESTSFNDTGDQSTALVHFQVPEKNFAAIIDTLSKMGKVVQKNISGQDVTGQIANTDGRITSLADEEKNLINELNRARTTDTRLEIRARLSSVRQQMEGLKAENKALKDLADMSRVSLVLSKAGEFDQSDPGDWLGQTTQSAGGVAGYLGRVFGSGIVYVLFLSPFWGPIALGVWWWRKRKA